MATLTQDTPRDYEWGQLNEFPVLTNSLIYEGAAVGLDASGNVRALQAGDVFVGFCEQSADATIQTHELDTVRVRVRTQGLVQLDIPNVTTTHVSQDVYASDDNTFSLSGEKQSRIGHVYRVVRPGTAIVRFEGV